MLPSHHEEACSPTAPPPNYSTLPSTESPPAAHPHPPPPPPPQQHPQWQQHQQHSMILHAAYRPGRSPTFRRLSARHTEFKVGFVGLFLSALLFIVGYSTPAWANKSGLWMACSWGQCHTNVGVGPGWLDATRSMETLALVCFLLCVAVALYEEVFKSPPPQETKAVEILAALAAIFGLIGVAIYGAKVPRIQKEVVDYYNNYISYRSVYINWSYGLTAAGSILVLICAVLVAHSRVTHAAQTQHSMALAGVMPPVHQPPFQPMMPSHPLPTCPARSPTAPPMGYLPQVAPYPHFYPCPCPYPYPLPAVTTLTAPSMYAPSTVAAPGAAQSTSAGAGPREQGPSTSRHQSDAESGSAPTSQIPMYFVMTQGRPLPVYDRLPSGTETS